ncbi:MAG: hypothetical protein KDK70_14795 [Myxococcales bacterium]|nr:hypothetical protein [Myxococcales bacterium]
MLGACAGVDDAHGDFDMEFRGADSGSSDGGDGDYSRDSGQGENADPERPGGGGEWLSNGLDDPNYGGIDVAHGLDTTAGLSDAAELVDDQDWRNTVRYVVECALPAGHVIERSSGGTTYQFHGRLGLAPQWESGACDEDCQQWVTACLLARTNVTGQTIPLWLQADHDAIGFGLPDQDVVFEASYYGNIFADPGQQYLCKGQGNNVVAAQREGRTCISGGSENCGFTTYNNCFSHDRCAEDGPDADVYTGCKSGHLASSTAYHTIAVYVAI